jgi:hypothetical protein
MRRFRLSDPSKMDCKTKGINDGEAQSRADDAWFCVFPMQSK